MNGTNMQRGFLLVGKKSQKKNMKKIYYGAKTFTVTKRGVENEKLF